MRRLNQWRKELTPAPIHELWIHRDSAIAEMGRVQHHSSDEHSGEPAEPLTKCPDGRGIDGNALTALKHDIIVEMSHEPLRTYFRHRRTYQDRRS